MARKSRWGKQPEPPHTHAPEVYDAWVYGRLSVENEDSEESLETQVAYCKDYIDCQEDLTYGGSFEEMITLSLIQLHSKEKNIKYPNI
jgi:hypothetical protein